MKIVTDTSALMKPNNNDDLIVIPINIHINGKSFKEYIDLTTDSILKMVKNGAIPKTSQPSIGEVMEVFENNKEEIIFLSAADGISGAYQNTLSVKNSMEDGERIHVVNTKTVLGPHHYLVEKALKMQKEGFPVKTILDDLSKCIESSVSFLIPSDFEFLKRGGRLTPLAATIGGLMKVVPVMTLSEDRRRVEKHAIKRTLRAAVDDIIHKFKDLGVNEDFIISVSHIDALEKAREIYNQMKTEFTKTRIDFFELSPAFIAQAGPGCVTIQIIHI